jgi:histidinol-phosphate aminotransferase
MIAPVPHIFAMAPYALSHMSAPEGVPLISLSQNESIRPPSPLALEAAARSLADTALYPDPDWTDLRQGLADVHSIPADAILCGSGSLDLIGCIARAFAGPDRAVLAPAHAYPFFRSAAQMVGARFDTALETNATVNVDALLEAAKPDTRIVFVANPGNPTGTLIPRSELFRLRQGLKEDVLLVIDEAYGEFADHIEHRTFDLVEQGATIVLRTFSKAYGMAGLRVGWGVFPLAIAAEVRKVMNPNNISTPAQAAATAALKDTAYMEETCQLIAHARHRAMAALKHEGFRVIPSYTNFLLIDLETSAKANSADRALRAQGIFLRGQSGAGLPQMLRLTIGPADAMAAAISCLTDWKRETLT